MKRRRLEEARRRGAASPPPSNNEETTPPPPSKSKPKPKPKDPPLDIKASLRSRRAAADEARALDEEALHQSLNSADIEALRDLAVVEEFEIPVRSSRPSNRTHHNGTTTTNNSNGTANGHDNGDRYNPLWSGRKNFKKFRPQGSGNTHVRRGGQAIIIPLEEVRRKEFGIGEEYWLEGGRKRKRRDGGSQSQSQMVVEEEEESLGGVASGTVGVGTDRKAKGKGKRNVPKELLVEDDDEMADVIDVEAPRRTRGMETQTQKSLGGGKSQGGRKQQATLAPKEEESDSEDELKFRFGKRRRMQQ
ncbi:MAG: hypothetical protein Q9170_006171 [Blastenia crenularia]